MSCVSTSRLYYLYLWKLIFNNRIYYHHLFKFAISWFSLNLFPQQGHHIPCQLIKIFVSKGLDVYAIDSSKVAIKNLTTTINKLNLHINLKYRCRRERFTFS
jgi:hypothetical protein